MYICQVLTMRLRAKVSLVLSRTACEIAHCVYPCPCGYFNDPVKECTDSLAQVLRYQNRISGPLLDRIDIHVEVPRVDYEKLSGDRLGEPSIKIRERVEKARERQRARFAGTNLQCNGDMGPGEVRKFCTVDDAGKSLLRAAMRAPSAARDCRDAFRRRALGRPPASPHRTKFQHVLPHRDQ